MYPIYHTGPSYIALSCKSKAVVHVPKPDRPMYRHPPTKVLTCTTTSTHAVRAFRGRRRRRRPTALNRIAPVCKRQRSNNALRSPAIPRGRQPMYEQTKCGVNSLCRRMTTAGYAEQVCAEGNTSPNTSKTEGMQTRLWRTSNMLWIMAMLDKHYLRIRHLPAWLRPPTCAFRRHARAGMFICAPAGTRDKIANPLGHTLWAHN